MAEIARNYHNDLQSDGDDIPQERRQQAANEVLNEITPKPGAPGMARLATMLEKTDIERSLNEAARGRAAGIEGIPMEFWTRMRNMFREAAKLPKDPQRETCNIVKILTVVFNDIETHGVKEATDFAAGWMCPIYKKKDATDIANYRPITVLNSDYKLFTRALNNRLSEVAGQLIHKDQTGFVKGRHITDPIYLAIEVLEYAEEELQNGAIVALDQEKAYDKTLHTYLWQTLQRFGIPNLFINTVKSLYRFANTCVIINGETSSFFCVRRGVCQGDPLSCLLFNLAIEPLAEMPRNSGLRGYLIPGTAERMIVQLFADDTTVYLHETDEFGVLQRILDKRCLASGARFNVAKTEIVPYGTEDYRAQLAESHRLNPESQAFPPNVNPARDGESKRLLGAQVGNKVDAFMIWTPLLDSIRTSLEHANHIHSTFEERCRIAQMIVASKTQYFTQVNGMPPEILKQILKMMRGYLSGGKSRLPINMETLMAPKEEGGLGLVDVEARNEAIELTKFGILMERDTEKQPAWAKIAAHRLSQHPVGTELKEETHRALYLQSWHPNQDKVPQHLCRTMAAVRKYGVVFDTNEPQLPVWHHFGARPGVNQINNGIRQKCLRKNKLCDKH
uniref:Reverse transcriptase domain-containing protein n=1 Tax=Mycena chlorophos TaxID=658473 RepID=A0ABQ0KXX5_MYCCL|nr:predicted protein [Mycena chlorophos]